MKDKALLVTGVLAALTAACGSKTSIGVGRDGAADLPRGTGGSLGPDAAGSGGSLGSGGGLGQGGIGPLGAGGLATGTGGRATGSGGRVVGSGGLAIGSGGAGGKTGSGGMGGLGGEMLDAGIAHDAMALDMRPQLDGTVDTARDAALDVTAPSCTALGGSCNELVSGCATCPTGSAPAASKQDCPSQSWCCTPLPAVTDECWNNGGMCIPGLNSVCPTGWQDVWTSCRNADSKCCMPRADVCNTVPKKCAEVGGVCTKNRWTRCPAGTEPYSAGSDQLGCEASGDGWCCVDAPPSPCADSTNGGMCIPGAQCTGCFAAHSDPAMTCESGRVCCTDVCD